MFVNRFVLISIFLSYVLISFSQVLSENDIKKLAQKIDNELTGTDLGHGITIQGCYAVGRTLIYQYDVDENWYPPQNMKDVLISNFKESGYAKVYFKNDVNVDFHYYSGNKLVKRLSIKSKEFSDLDFELGDYLSINGHPKAKGVNLKLKTPTEWKIKEGDRPNIVKKFVYDNNSYMIIVKNNMTFFSRNKVREFFEDDDYVNGLISDVSSSLKNPEVLDQGVVTVDKYPALFFTVEGQKERTGIRMSLVFKTWIIYYEDKIVLLQCGGENNKEFYSLEGVYNQITNSVIFPDQYNE